MLVKDANSISTLLNRNFVLEKLPELRRDLIIPVHNSTLQSFLPSLIATRLSIHYDHCPKQRAVQSEFYSQSLCCRSESWVEDPSLHHPSFPKYHHDMPAQSFSGLRSRYYSRYSCQTLVDPRQWR